MDAVLDVISEELGIFKEDISLEDNFFELGGNSANAVSVVVKLRREGYQKVKIPDILNSQTIEGLISSVTDKSNLKYGQPYIDQAEKVFKLYIMDEKSDRNAINKLIADAYFHNNKIFRTLATEEAFRLFMERNYNVMTQQKLSRYMVDTRTKKIAACNITIDLTTRLECTYGFGDVWEVLGVAKSFADPVISKDRGRWADSYFTAISPGLPPDVGTYLLMKMEDTSVELSEDAGFEGILCCQMHPAAGAYCDLQIESGFKEVGQINLRKHRFSDGRLLFEHLPDKEVSRTIIKRF